MRLPKLVLSILSIFSIATFAIAQTQPSDADADKEKKTKELNEKVVQILDQSISDVETLRLPQNRAAPHRGAFVI